MLKIAALNDNFSESSNEIDATPSQEIYEAEATREYKCALACLANDESNKAKEIFVKILNNPYISKAKWNAEVQVSKNLPQEIILKYSCYKNLANLLMIDKKYKEASDYYLEALKLDKTEVTLWQKLGSSAIKIKYFQLALIAFQEGLRINQNHWPCLDQLLSVTFILQMYEDCLGLILQSLKKNKHYTKALAFKNKIFEVEPSLKNFVAEYFIDSHILFEKVPYDEEAGNAFINMCLTLRPPPKERPQPRFISPVQIDGKIDRFSWANILNLFVNVYDNIERREPSAIAGRIQTESFMKNFINKKLENQKVNESHELQIQFLDRGQSVDENELSGAKRCRDNDNLDRTPKRRKTIDSFPESNNATETELENVTEKENCFTDNKGELASLKDKRVGGIDIISTNTANDINEVHKLKIGEANNTQEDNEKKSTESFAREIKDDSSQQSQTTVNSENESDACATASQNEDDDDKTYEADNFVSSQAAAEQLKDMMALDLATAKQDTFANDFLEYFDNEGYVDNDVAMEFEYAYENDQINEDKIVETKLPEGQQEEILNLVNKDGKIDNELLNLNPVTDKKPKRTKRGLERELEQLDYWGRRKAREAKRRRRTLTSKLVGSYEDSESLTWAHLIENFIPAALRSKTSKLQISEFSSSNTSESDLTKKEGTVLKRYDSEPKVEGETEEKNSVIENTSFFASFNRDICEKLTWNNEEIEVGEFIYSLKSNTGILDVLNQCSSFVIKKFKKIWPLECAVGYTKLFSRYRKHMTIGSLLSEDSDVTDILKNYCKAVLVNSELLFSLNSVEMNVGTDENKLLLNKINDPEFHFVDDLTNVQLLLARPEVWDSVYDYMQAQFRIACVQSQVKLLCGQTEEAALFYQVLITIMQMAKNDENHLVLVDRCRVASDKMIYDINYFKNKLDNLKKSEIVEKIEPKFRAGHYSDIIPILKSMFTDEMAKKESNDLCPSRHTQLLILTESLVKISDVGQVIEWGGKCLGEAVDSFCCSEEDSNEKRKWSNVVRKLLLFILEALWNDFNEDKRDFSEPTIYLISQIVRVLVIQLEVGSNLSEPYFSTLSPWIILHLILSVYERREMKIKNTKSQDNMRINDKGGEDKEKKPKDNTSSENLTDENSKTQKNRETSDEMNEEKMEISREKTEQESKERISSSDDSKEDDEELKRTTLMLITAHDELGKNQWCCKDEGQMLLYMLDVIIAEGENESLSEDHSTTLHQCAEQIMYCLYGHPAKRAKYKHIRDHGGASIRLTWRRAIQLYEYYLPEQLPDFQSSQVPSINDDVMILYRRILSLMPDNYKQANQSLSVQRFIDGEINVHQIKTYRLPEEVNDIYYLLADNHFKSKEWNEAIDYYILDISINPNRLDSWAPIGLAKKIKLETLLNSCEIIKSDEELFKECRRAVRCIDRGLEIDEYFCNLLVEKAGLVYMIHSHSSRILKQDLIPDISIELFQSLEKVKNDMIDLAAGSFLKATRIIDEGLDDTNLPDESWLYQYMLGKIAEKMMMSEPFDVLKRYLDAFKRLHSFGAKYPLKINYNNPLNFSIEALEMYFRIHSHIFKYLHHRDEKEVPLKVLELYEYVLNKLEQSPFITRKSDDHDFDWLDNIDEFYSKICIKVENQNDTKVKINRLVLKCIKAFETCLIRFPNHYKSLYRLAYFYHHSSSHKDNFKARNLLLGSHSWQSLNFMPCNGLFSDRKINVFYPKNSNLFNEVWRIPQEEIDRPGSFAAHMCKCISLCLEVLREIKDFYTILEIAVSLLHSPEKDKKYLRENERKLLCEHATVVGIQVMKDKFQSLFKKPATNPNKEAEYVFILQAYKAHKPIGKHLLSGDTTFTKIFIDAYCAYKGINKEGRANINVIKEAETFCSSRNTNSHLGNEPSSQINLQNKNNDNINSSGQQVIAKSPGYTTYCVSTPSQISKNSENKPSNIVQEVITKSPGYTTYSVPVSCGTKKSPQAASLISPTISSPFKKHFGSNRSSFNALAQEHNLTPGQAVAVQQAYKVYENLIELETKINNGSLDEIILQKTKKEHEEYKKSMLKYLQIPSVSQFFHSSLQNLSGSPVKLPPPLSAPVLHSKDEKLQQNVSSTTSLSFSQLAAKAKPYGVSIASVDKSNIQSNSKEEISKVSIYKCNKPDSDKFDIKYVSKICNENDCQKISIKSEEIDTFHEPIEVNSKALDLSNLALKKVKTEENLSSNSIVLTNLKINNSFATNEENSDKTKAETIYSKVTTVEDKRNNKALNKVSTDPSAAPLPRKKQACQSFQSAFEAALASGAFKNVWEDEKGDSFTVTNTKDANSSSNCKNADSKKCLEISETSLSKVAKSDCEKLDDRVHNAPESDKKADLSAGNTNVITLD